MVKNVEKENTEQRILDAARNIFIQKGMAGARMQDIADAAGINKALLHYYFRSKENLYRKIMQESARKLFPQLDAIFNADLHLSEKLAQFCAVYIDIVQENPCLPMFILNEMQQGPQQFFETFWSSGQQPRPQRLIQDIQEAVERGEIRKVEPRQLLMHLISMTLFPFIAGPMIQKVMSIDAKDFQQMMQKRKKEIPDFIMNAIKI